MLSVLLHLAGEHGYHLMIVPFAGSLERTAAFVRTYREAWAAQATRPGAERIQMSFHCYVAQTHKASTTSRSRCTATSRCSARRSAPGTG